MRLQNLEMVTLIYYDISVSTNKLLGKKVKINNLYLFIYIWIRHYKLNIL